MEVVFLINFTEGCFRAIPALAQMADDLAIRLTLLHTFDPEKEQAAAAEDRLASFFPEADRFADTRRVTLPGPFLAAVRAHVARCDVDLFVVPDSDRLRLPRLGPSLRAELILASEAPVWTIGPRVRHTCLIRPPRRIACWFDPDATNDGYLRLAAELARQLGGELHIVHVTPEFHEGASLRASVPQHASEVATSVGVQIDLDVPLEVHVAPGGDSRAVLDLMQRCEPDLLILSPRRSVRSRLFGPDVSRLVDLASCPVICVGEAARVPRVLPGPGLEALAARARAGAVS